MQFQTVFQSNAHRLHTTGNQRVIHLNIFGALTHRCVDIEARQLGDQVGSILA